MTQIVPASASVLRTVILGAPASGKGTVSGRIVKQFNWFHLSCGDILRLHQQNKTTLGLEAAKYISSGKLVPDSVVTQCILDNLQTVPAEKSWLLDGFPRTIQQAVDLQAGHNVDCVINLDVPHDVIIDRVKGRWVHLASGRVYNTGFNSPRVPFRDDVTGEPLIQRDDDNPDTVKQRLDVYAKYTKPLIEFYQKAGKLQTFHGSTTDVIWPQVNEYLTSLTCASPK